MSKWRTKSIDEIAKVSAGGTPSTDVLEYWDKGTIPWMASGEIHKKRVKVTEKKITQLGLQKSSARFFPKKTVLIALAGQGKTRGTVAISEMELTTNQSIAGIVIEDKDVYPDYVFYNLDSRYLELRQISTGGGREGLNLEIIKNIELSLPPIAEQNKIAKILSSVDKVIELTELEIEKLQNLKKGMMQDLLAKGIGHAKFKDSPLGKIPESWRVAQLDELTIITRLAGAEYTDFWEVDQSGSIVALRGQNIGENELILNDCDKISEKLSQKLIRSKLFKGDIVFPCVGSIGKAVLINENDKFHINQNIAKITANSKIAPEFLLNVLLSDATKNQILKFNTSSSQPNVLVGNLRKFLVPLPDTHEEQLKIAELLFAISQSIQTKKNKFKSLINLKKGFMQDLLAGKVRVKI